MYIIYIYIHGLRDVRVQCVNRKRLTNNRLSVICLYITPCYILCNCRRQYIILLVVSFLRIFFFLVFTTEATPTPVYPLITWLAGNALIRPTRVAQNELKSCIYIYKRTYVYKESWLKETAGQDANAYYYIIYYM